MPESADGSQLDKTELCKIGAHHNLTPKSLRLISIITSENVLFVDKLKSVMSLCNCSKLEDFQKTDSIQYLSKLILHTLVNGSNRKENVLLLGTMLKTSFLAVINLCTPTLLYSLLIEGGKSLRKNIAVDEVLVEFYVKNTNYLALGSFQIIS